MARHECANSLASASYTHTHTHICIYILHYTTSKSKCSIVYYNSTSLYRMSDNMFMVFITENKRFTDIPSKRKRHMARVHTPLCRLLAAINQSLFLHLEAVNATVEYWRCRTDFCYSRKCYASLNLIYNLNGYKWITFRLNCIFVALNMLSIHS